MEQLVNGRFEYEVPSLVLSQDRILLATAVGENYRGLLQVGTSDNMKIKGIVTVTNARIIIGVDKFSGTTAQIPFGIDVTGLKAGETCKGFINLETSIGERQVPVYVEITEPVMKTSRGEVNSLEDFADLAHGNMREAFRLYNNSEAFMSLLERCAPQQMTLYRGMSENPVTYQHLEEFLVGAGLKDAISIQLDEGDTSFYNLTSSKKSTLMIQKNTWGYLNVEVEVIGDFIEVQKKRIISDDFVGSHCQLDYIIRYDRLGKGRRFGKIILKSVYGSQFVEIVASKNSPVRVDMGAVRKRNMITLTETYLKYRMHRLDEKAWATKTLSLLEAVRQMGECSVEYTLYEVYVNYESGNLEEASRIMRSLESHSFNGESVEAKALFLYLGERLQLLSSDKIDLVERLRTWQRKKQESMVVLWMLFKVDEDIKRTPVKKIYYMENLYHMGCRSPLLYLEAYDLICQDIGLLKRINGFWTKVLHYIAREDLFTEEIALRAAYLSANEKEFTKSIYYMLGKAYEKYPKKDILNAICKLIMKGDPRKKEFFRWYELAVEHEIKITRLYEYYIETMPENYQKMLPQVIRMYFAYNNTLSDRKKAFVYANVIRNKELDRNTYTSYKASMEQFAKDKLLQGKINEDYAVIYQEFIREIKQKDLADAMSAILFTHRLYCDDKKVRHVIVCHGPLNKEEYYPCVDGVAYISIYTKGAKILFQDDMSRRYVATIEYNLQKLLDTEFYIPQCVAFDSDTKGLMLHVCGDDCRESNIHIGNILMFQRISNSDAFTSAYKHQVRKKLLEYYSVHAGDDTLDGYLRKIDYDKFAKVDKVLLIEVLIDRGMYEKAYELTCRFGHEHIAIQKLVRLCSRLIDKYEGEPEVELLQLSYYVFTKGKYDDRILTYLLNYYEGALGDMCRIRTSGKEFFLETYRMDERILRYSMFVRKHVDIGGDVLKAYLKQGGRELVVMAYLTFEAFGYFWGETEAKPYIFDLLATAYTRGMELDGICHLSLLKYYSIKRSLTGTEESLVAQLLEKYYQEGLRFAFYQKLPKVFLQQYQLEDRIFVEQKAAPGDKVTLYYKITTENGKEEAFKSEPMKMMYHGIFSREFVLFYGETLTYYVVIERGGNALETCRKSLTMPNIDMNGRSKYQMINQMLAAKKLGKEKVLKETALKYCQAERIAEELFPLMK